MPPSGSTRRKRQRGEIETLPSGSLRVRVYAGIDPISRKRHYLTEVIPPGKDAARQAENRLIDRHDGRRQDHGNQKQSQRTVDRLHGDSADPASILSRKPRRRAI